MKNMSAALKTIIQIYNNLKYRRLSITTNNINKSFIKNTILERIGLEENSIWLPHSSIRQISKRGICNIFIKHNNRQTKHSFLLILIFSLETYFLFLRQALMNLTSFFRMILTLKEILNGSILGLIIRRKTRISRLIL